MQALLLSHRKAPYFANDTKTRQEALLQQGPRA